jgi:hypothetical protein
MSEPTTVVPWTERLYKFAAKLPRKDAADLATDLEAFSSDLEEIVDLIPELTEQLNTWADDDADRSDRADAKENADQMVNDLHGLLNQLAKTLGTYEG